MGDLCRLLSRSTKFNIAIYVIAVLFVVCCGGLWIYGKTREDSEEQTYWVEKSFICTAVGLIVVSLLTGANMIYYELAFNKKCGVFERWLDDQTEKLKTRLNPNAIATKVASETSRVMAETFADKFKEQFGRAVLDQITKGIPGGEEIANLLNPSSSN